MARAEAGRLMVVAESYKGARNDALLGPVMRLLGSSRLSMDDHRALFLAAGYEGVQIAEERAAGLDLRDRHQASRVIDALISSLARSSTRLEAPSKAAVDVLMAVRLRPCAGRAASSHRSPRSL
jgi:hypothetical protein